MLRRTFIAAAAVALAASGCVVQQPSNAPQSLTLGAAQVSIHKGLTQAEVAEAIGAPNMVTRDKQGVETWIYDRASTTYSSSRSEAYGTVLLLGGSASSGSATTSQRTLTLIIKFKDGIVSEFTYRSTSF